MAKCFLWLFLYVFALEAIAQPSLSGVVNIYSSVIAADYCLNKFTLTNTGGFNEGEKVVIIQMKGAVINPVNNASFGEIVTYGYAGAYEVNVIDTIQGNDVVFRYNLLYPYDPSGALQIISLPEFSSAAVSAPLTAQAWDGSTGGVIALMADTLILNDTVKLKGLGFRGASLANETGCWNNGNGGSANYFGDNTVGARKGEGIGNTPAPFGRGCNANGGGGGNDHNTGGGGGSNYGKGGNGGIRSNVSQFSCPGPGPGVGGRALTYDTTLKRIFMGGGGGAGDENNNEGTAGANGGGIGIIIAKVLVGNNNIIDASGDDVVAKALSDGAGAGGAGGTVLLQVDNYIGNVNVLANGGRGGNLTNGGSLTYCFGPGGGGGGGALWVKGNTISPQVSFQANGGNSGINTFMNSSNCPYGTTNGAQAGDPGGSIANLDIPFASELYIPFSAAACCDTLICKGDTITLQASGTPAGLLSYYWSTADSSAQISEQLFSNKAYTVTVTDNRFCTATFTITATVSQTFVDMLVAPDTAIVPGQQVQLTAIGDLSGTYTYSWSPATYLSSTTVSNPVATPEVTTQYCVVVTDTNNCTAEVCRTIEIIMPDVKVPDAFTPNGDGINDLFEIFATKFAQIKIVRIYNRWGELVYESAANQPWDGTYKGKVQNQDSYVCTVEYGSSATPNRINRITKNFLLIR